MLAFVRCGIPGLVMVIGAFATWRGLLLTGLEPDLVWVNQERFEFLYMFGPWLVALPPLGAAGAFWARRSGARPLQRAMVSLFPALASSSVFALGLVAQVLTNPSDLAKHIFGVTLIIVSFVVIPGVALLLGALPFLRNSSQTAAKPV